MMAANCLPALGQPLQPTFNVNLIQAPAGSLVPDVLLDAAGILHMVYAQNQNGYYVRSYDNGATFTPPVTINASGTVEYNMGERGPKLAVSADGTIHVAWMDHWESGVSVYARYTRSTNGGISFENLKTISATPGVDGVTVTADEGNHVVLFWHTMVPVQTQVPQATWLHFARSADKGISFTADTNVVITNHSGLACTMCMTRARPGAGGTVLLAFRSAENSIRDFYMLKGDPAANDFTAIRVNYDNWNINYCPMVGPSLETADDGRHYCAYMTGNHVYWSVADAATGAFSLHVATPLNEFDEIYPQAVPDHSGHVLFVWQVGPMSVSDSATVKWALYNTDGTYTGQQGIAGRTFSGTKADAFFGSDNQFHIVINTAFMTSAGPPVATPVISLFPDPAHQYLCITGLKSNCSVRFFNQSGEQVLETNGTGNITVDLRTLKCGTYSVVLEDKKQRIVKKIVVSG